MARPLIVFDMDGVLADVTDSYREAIVQTVKHFTGREIPRPLIQEYKNRGGWNNDWALSQRICADLGVDVAYATVVEYFNGIFMGADGSDGLILRERWIASEGMLERLAESHDLAIFTGRLRAELAPTLKRFAPALRFAPILCADDVTRGKPAPDGLIQIRETTGATDMLYVGDTVDDARCARAAGAPFIGVAASASHERARLVELFEQERAIAIVENVNELEGVLANR